MPLPAPLHYHLPATLPDNFNARLCLLAIRRLGSHGLEDAQVAHHLHDVFGHGFSRPLIALRIMMAELSVAASSPLLIAPSCCYRMTGAEQALMDIIARAGRDTASARILLTDLLGNKRVDSALSSIILVAGAFADGGRPLR